MILWAFYLYFLVEKLNDTFSVYYYYDLLAIKKKLVQFLTVLILMDFIVCFTAIS